MAAPPAIETRGLESPRIENLLGRDKESSCLLQFKLLGLRDEPDGFGLHAIASYLIRLGDLLKPVIVEA